jgi:prevent-host-death family protein
MRTVSASEAKQNFAAMLDAAQREPVMIRRHDRDVAVLISTQDYERIRRSNIEEFLRLTDEAGQRAAERGMSEGVLKKLLAEEKPRETGL